CKFLAVFAFGDSNTDTGGIFAAFYPAIPPYGRTFFNRPAGRASDGRLIIDFIAEHLGVPYLSPYLDSLGSTYKHGANFATGGATILHPDESWFVNGVSPFSLDIQVEHFTQFKNKITYFHSTGATGNGRLMKPGYFSEALFVLDIGQNDLAAGQRKLSLENQKQAIPNIISQLITQIQNLYERGGRYFWVHNTGPIGCLPVSVAKVGSAEKQQPGTLDEVGCVKSQNEVAMEFNRQLRDEIYNLRRGSNLSIVYVDIYGAKYELVRKARELGLGDPFGICCGYHGIGYDIWCGNSGALNGSQVYADSCSDPSAVISWDGVHYSEAANRWISNQIINGSFSDPPTSIHDSCHAQ
ncbi:acetylcholinesterase, partial [Genlisea aurea]